MAGQLAVVDSYLEADGAFSLHWLARDLGVSYDEVVQLVDLHQAKLKKSDAAKKLFVETTSVKKECKYLQFKLTPEAEIESLSKGNAELTPYIYGKPSFYCNVQITNALDDRQLIQIFQTMTDRLPNDFKGDIVLPSLKIAGSGERTTAMAIHTDVSTIVKGSKNAGESAEDHISRVFPAKSTALSKQQSSIQPSTFFKKEAPAKAKDDTKNLISAKQGHSTSASVPSASSSSQSSSGVAVPPQSPALAEEDDDDSEAEWEEEGVSNKKEKKAPSTATKDARLPIAQSPHREDRDVSENDSEVDLHKSTEPRKKRSRKRKEVLHGAMDDYMADGGDDHDKQDSSIQAKSKKKKKLVEKVLQC